MEHDLDLVNLHEIIGIFLFGRLCPANKAEGSIAEMIMARFIGSLPQAEAGELARLINPRWSSLFPAGPV